MFVSIMISFLFWSGVVAWVVISNKNKEKKNHTHKSYNLTRYKKEWIKLSVRPVNGCHFDKKSFYLSRNGRPWLLVIVILQRLHPIHPSSYYIQYWLQCYIMLVTFAWKKSKSFKIGLWNKTKWKQRIHISKIDYLREMMLEKNICSAHE